MNLACHRDWSTYCLDYWLCPCRQSVAEELNTKTQNYNVIVQCMEKCALVVPVGMSSRSSASFHVRRTRLPIPHEQELIPTACPLQARPVQLMSVRVLRYCPPLQCRQRRHRRERRER